MRLVEEDSKIEDINIRIQERNCILDELKANLHRAQERMKRLVDQSRHEVNYLKKKVDSKWNLLLGTRFTSRYNDTIFVCWHHA